MLKRKPASQLRFVPIDKVIVLRGNYVEGLAKYLKSKKWLPAKKDGCVVVRDDIGTAYVFEWTRFLALARKAQRLIAQIRGPRIPDDLLGRLADLFNIHETTPTPVVHPNETPSNRAVVQKGKQGTLDATRLVGAWIKDKKATGIHWGETVDDLRTLRALRTGRVVTFGRRRGRKKQSKRPSIKRSARGLHVPRPRSKKTSVPRNGGGRRKGTFKKKSKGPPTKRSFAPRRYHPAPPRLRRGGGRGAWRRSVTPSFSPPGKAALSRTARSARRSHASSPDQQETLRRTPHMDLSNEDPFSPRDKFDVSVYVDETAARPEESSKPVVIRASKKIREFSVMVHLSVTEHFAITGQQTKKILIKRDESKSESVKFTLKAVAMPKSGRAGTIVASFEYKGRPCGKVTRSVVVGPVSIPVTTKEATAADPDQPVASETSEGPRLEVITSARQPDMTITIINPSNDGRIFDVIVTTPLLPAYKAGVKGPWTLRDISSEIVRGYFEEFTKDNITHQQRLDALLGAGEDLFLSTPEHFRNAFWKIVDGRLPLRSIFVVSQEPFIPWELMIPSRKNAKGQDDVKDALGVTYSVGRWICGDNVSPEQRVPLTESRVVAPDYKGAVPAKLAKAADEAKFVLSKIPGRQISPAMYAAFDADMQTGGAPVLHFVCHGAAQTPVAQQIYFENGEIISSLQLSGNKAFRAALQKKKPLIFLNACEVGRPQPALVGVGGFAQKFIERGASVVIAPLWSVKDDIAHDIALEFYKTSEKYPNKPFAEILRDIRAKAYDSTTGAEDTYAAYCFYGDPLARRAAA